MRHCRNNTAKDIAISDNIKRDFYYDVYTILNQVLNPRQRSFAKQSSVKKLRSDAQKVPKQAEVNPQNYN